MALVKLRDVKKMLEECAPGFEITPKVHKRWVTWQGHKALLPKGPHGSGDNYAMEIGHVRQMVRKFGKAVEECARRFFPKI